MISVIVPAYNEENAIGDTIKNLFLIMNQSEFQPFEVIVVDDGSTDNTLKEAEMAGAYVIRHPHNIGYGRSLKDGINKAAYDTIAISDADGTYPINEIPNIVHQYQKGFDMVVGARQGRHYDGSLIKAVFRIILQALVQFTSGRKIPDINSGLRVFSKGTILPYFPRLCDTFSFTTSLTLAYMMTGKFVFYVPIDYHKRVGTTKVRLFRDSLRTMQFIVEAIVFYNPMKIFILFSGVLILFSIFGVLITVYFKILAGYILGIGAFLLAILMFGIGLLAVLLKQIMHGK
ncbi:MAG: glycosyltransferase family 2 protein [Desulfobacula sp.]|nr:glycosyltransferase family 2 protein [Desulfobacula sp.]